MELIRCDCCERTQPIDEVAGWLLVTRDGETTRWNFCSVTCLAKWANDAL